jgi:hypothetical protein
MTKGKVMPNRLWRAALTAVLNMVLATPGLLGQSQAMERPDLLSNSNGGAVERDGKLAVAGIVVVAVAIVVVTVILVKHRPQRVTGCIVSNANRMSVRDERDQRSYTLSGGDAGVKVGSRMTLVGKRKHAGHAFLFEVHRVANDFGACQS